MTSPGFRDLPPMPSEGTSQIQPGGDGARPRVSPPAEGQAERPTRFGDAMQTAVGRTTLDLADQIASGTSRGPRPRRAYNGGTGAQTRTEDFMRSYPRRFGLAARPDASRERYMRSLIDTMIAELPDEPPVYPASQRDSIPASEPSRLERFFVQRLPRHPGIDMEFRQEGTLAPQDSVDCLRDKVRTKLFMQGIAEAIAQLDTDAQDTIEVCDAGTGAVPVMAIYAALCSDKVRCAALELNTESALLAQQVVEQFGLQNRITVVKADATTYQPSKPVDLLISETMHSGLTAEPMVDILANLQPHVKPGGVTLPSAVHIKAALVPYKDYESAPSYIKINHNSHPSINPAWQDVMHYTPGQQLDAISFELDGKHLPDDDYIVAVTNDVIIGSKVLEPSQSLITMPQYDLDSRRYLRFFTITQGLKNTRQRVAVTYKPGDTLQYAARLQ